MSELASVSAPWPRRTRDSDRFWEACAEHRLELQRCTSCQAVRYPPMPGCPSCGSTATEWRELSPRGAIVRQTIVHARLHPAFEPPYALVVVAIDDGPLMLSRFVGDPSSAVFGVRVHGVWDDLPGAETSLLLFAPDES